MNKYLASVNLSGALLATATLARAPYESMAAIVSFVIITTTSWGFVISLVAAIKENR